MKKNIFAVLITAWCFSYFTEVRAQTNSVELISPIGSSVLYPSIKNAYAAIPLNVPANNNYVIELLPAYDGTDLSENYPIQLGYKNIAAGGSTITIRPAAGNIGETIQRPIPAAGNLIEINGGINIILDGRPGGITSVATDYLNVIDVFVGATNSNIRLLNGASNNKIQYINIIAATGNTAAGNRLININTSPVGQSNNHNIISNNIIRGGQRGVQVSGTAENNTGNIIKDNLIRDFVYYGVFGSANFTDSTTIQNNTIICSAIDSTNFNAGILNQGGVTDILNNTITSDLSNSTQHCVIVGIQLNQQSGKIATANIINNLLTDFIIPVGSPQGITVSAAGTINIKNNILRNFSPGFSGSFGIAGALAIGVFSYPGSTINITENNISEMHMDTLSGSVNGIIINPYQGGGIINISNNFIAITDANVNVGSIDGIRLLPSAVGATSPYTTNIFFNTIKIGGIKAGGTAGEFMTACIYKTDDYEGSIYTQKNNILIMDREGQIPGIDMVGFYMTNTTGVLDIDYNTYYGLGTGFNSYPCYFLNSFYDNTEEAAYKNVAMPIEQHSHFRNASFVSATDLHLSGNSLTDPYLNGTPIPMIDFDIDNDPRKPTIPTEGADENQFVIPVRLLSLTGETVANHNNIYWTIAFEQDNVGFEILRSNDGVNFAPIGFISSLAVNGNSSVPLKYQFIDANPLAPYGYYKLKQVDKNQRVVFSEVIKITSKSQPHFEIIKCYPNPAREYLNVVLISSENGSVNLEVYDVFGKLIINESFTSMEGENVFSLNTKNLASGSYTIAAILNKERCSFKFLKK